MRVQGLMSGWLNACDFAALLNPYLLARSAAGIRALAAKARTRALKTRHWRDRN